MVPVLAMVSSVGGWVSSAAAMVGKRLKTPNMSHNVDLCIAHLQPKLSVKTFS
jgi:hypothetical protein